MNILTYNICQKPLVGWLLRQHLEKFDNIYAIDFLDKRDFYLEFSNLIFYDQVLLKYAKVLDKNNSNRINLSFQRYFRKYEHLFHLIISRYDFNTSFNHFERIAYYRKLSSICLSLIIDNKIDEIIFYDYPHHADSFLIYHIGKFFNINIKIISYLYIFKNYRMVIDNDYDARFANFLKDTKYDSKDKFFIDDLIKKYKKSEKHIKPEYLQYKKYTIFFNSNSLLYLLLKDLYRSLRRGLFKDSNYVISTNSNRQFIDKKPPLEIYSVLLSFIGRLKVLNLKKNYKSYSVKPNFNFKFVLFCPNVQPEASTLPLANDFVDFRNIIELLEKYIPKHWKIFYKEHPLTFSLVKEAYLSKNKNYYKNIISDRLILIDYDFDTYKLINNSEFVVTPTGSIGIESLAKLKIVLNFGTAWWRNYKNVFNITDEEKLDNTLQLIIKNKINISELDLQTDVLNTFEKTIDFPHYYIENEKNIELLHFFNSKEGKKLKDKFNHMISF